VTPEFEELVGGPDLAPEERARLLSAHDALVLAGPPAELSPSLRRAPKPEGEVVRMPSGRRRATLLLVAAAALIAFSLGVGVARQGGEAFAASWTLPMHGTVAAPTARATIAGAKADHAGNWRMQFEVRGLPRLRGEQYYVLWLTIKGRPIAECGQFKVGLGKTMATFTEPYKRTDFDGWVVTLWRGPKTPMGPVVLRTSEI